MAAEDFRQAQRQLLAGPVLNQPDAKPFRWPALARFNWALDWFDEELGQGPCRDNFALQVLGDQAEKITFAEMSARSNRIANGLRNEGVRRGDRILLMLGNVAPLWETMLAAMKVGAIIVPSTLMLTEADLAERIERARVQHVIVAGSELSKFARIPARVQRICTGDPPAGWLSFNALRASSPIFEAPTETVADDPMLLYFTSGTTSRPKMVLHSHQSYPVGHLATMYWIGAKPGDIHMAIGTPGWAGHTFMAFFGPWNAGATVTVLNQPRFDACVVLEALVSAHVTSFFAPPTVWRMLLQQDLTQWPVVLREAVSAGEPLNPEVIERIRSVWGITIRDGWGQTEATVQIANPPGEPVRIGSLGRALPGCKVAVIDANDNETDDGELALPLHPRPPGLMVGYLHEDGSILPLEGAYYRTGDAVARNPDGTFTYIGRVDDVFKSSDYRISPFELESVLIEHPAIIEAAVVPSPDELRLAVPKAFVALSTRFPPNRETALSIFQHVRSRVAPYKRIRRLAFSELPKNAAGKIRRVELRQTEAGRDTNPPVGEFEETQFPELS